MATVVGAPDTADAGPPATSRPEVSRIWICESFGSGASVNVMITRLGACASVAPSGGSDNRTREWASAPMLSASVAPPASNAAVKNCRTLADKPRRR